LKFTVGTELDGPSGPTAQFRQEFHDLFDGTLWLRGDYALRLCWYGDSATDADGKPTDDEWTELTAKVEQKSSPSPGASLGR
jgi:hypothetical protein